MKALLASGMFDKPGAGGDDGAVLTTTADFAAVEGMLMSQELCVMATFLEEEIPEGAIVVVGEKDEGGADAEILRQREEQARALEKETEAKKAAEACRIGSRRPRPPCLRPSCAKAHDLSGRTSPRTASRHLRNSAPKD